MSHCKNCCDNLSPVGDISQKNDVTSKFLVGDISVVSLIHGEKMFRMQQKNDVISKFPVGDISVVSLQNLM